jgi:hypothetical protein
MLCPFTPHLYPAETIEQCMGRYHDIMANMGEPTIVEQASQMEPRTFSPDLNTAAHSIVSFDVVKFYTR